MGHVDTCLCEYCTYLRLLDKARDKVGAEGVFQFIEDPFKPTPTEEQARREAKREAFRRTYSGDPDETIKTYFCQSCQGYHREGYVHPQTGRFKVHHPPYEQKRRHNHPGRYRRIYSNEFDWIEWQYKPWPEAEWVIYYKVSAEMIKREVASIGTKLAGKKFNTAASEALSKERYHKIERIDAPA